MLSYVVLSIYHIMSLININLARDQEKGYIAYKLEFQKMSSYCKIFIKMLTCCTLAL